MFMAQLEIKISGCPNRSRLTTDKTIKFVFYVTGLELGKVTESF